MFHGHLDYFQKPPLESRPITKLRDHATPNTHNHWFILFYHVWRPAWIEIHWNGIWSRIRSHVIPHYTWGSMTTLHTWFWRCVGTAFGHFLLGSHNFMITALDSCVKWPFSKNKNCNGLVNPESTTKNLDCKKAKSCFNLLAMKSLWQASNRTYISQVRSIKDWYQEVML